MQFNKNLECTFFPSAISFCIFVISHVQFPNRITEFWKVCKINFLYNKNNSYDNFMGYTANTCTKYRLPVKPLCKFTPPFSLNLFLLCIHSCGWFFCNRIAQCFQRHTQPSVKPLTLLYCYTNKQWAVFLLFIKNERDIPSL